MARIRLKKDEFDNLTEPGFFDRIMKLFAILQEEVEVDMWEGSVLAGPIGGSLYNVADVSEFPKLVERLEGMPEKTIETSTIRKSLVRLADKFDREGKADLADAVDNLISAAARPKAPLKSLDDDVKKDLLKFIHRVKENIDDSMEALEEFFRRLRYFDIGDTVKDLKLDKALKELTKTNDCIDAAGRAMYALTHGKHPSKADLEQMVEDFGSSKKETENPLDFFESQGKDPTPERDLIGLDEKDELLGSFISGPTGTKEIDEEGDEEYEEFIKGIYRSEDEEELESFEDEPTEQGDAND
jgi:hypothetical protein